jgi:hypothetical protein
MIVDEGVSFDAETAKEKVALTETSFTTVKATTDVNISGTTDINDAQLVYDMYNNVYQDIATVGMVKFLRADIGGDRVIDVLDAAAVVSAILNQ